MILSPLLVRASCEATWKTSKALPRRPGQGDKTLGANEAGGTGEVRSGQRAIPSARRLVDLRLLKNHESFRLHPSNLSAPS